jgi:hypothetical protein
MPGYDVKMWKHFVQAPNEGLLHRQTGTIQFVFRKSWRSITSVFVL